MPSRPRQPMPEPKVKLRREYTWDLIIRGKARPHVFRFAQQPTLEDFLAVCRMLPWTGVWDDGLIPAIKKCQWPEVAPGYKANHVVIPEYEVELTIERSEVWQREED